MADVVEVAQYKSVGLVQHPGESLLLHSQYMVLIDSMSLRPSLLFRYLDLKLRWLGKLSHVEIIAIPSNNSCKRCAVCPIRCLLVE